MLPHNTMIEKTLFISCFKSKAHVWYEFKIKISIAYCYPCSSLGMGLPSYNNYVGLCVFLFVKTKEYYYFVSYHFVIQITVKTYNYGTLG